MPAFAGVPTVDALLTSKVNAAPLALTPVIITYDHKPASADFLALKALGIQGGVALRELPIVLTVVTRAQLQSLRTRSGIVSLYANRTMRLFDNKSRPFIGQTALREDDEVTAESYGALKALCEGAVRDVFADRTLVVRPGLIVGPHDPTGRFTYWPHRVARGGEVLAPGPPERRTQFVDVRDLGEWIVTLLERDAGGTFNATHPGIAWAELLDTCREVSGSDASVTWVTDELLVEQDVGQWLELPLWLAGPEVAAADDVDVSRALEAGLGFRPLAETIRGTLADAALVEGVGLTPEREAALLERWHGG